MQFRPFTNAIVIPVLPKPQRGENCISLIDDSITIADAGWLIVFGEG